MKWGIFSASILVAITICAILVHIKYPIPNGITEPEKFRMLTISTKFLDYLIHFRSLIQPIEFVDIITMRQITALITWLGKAQREVTDDNIAVTVTTFDGVLVRIFEPAVRSNETLPGFIYLHGGGACLGDTEFYAWLTGRFAKEVNAIVVSVEYPLAPENPFPIPFETSLAASKYFLDNAEAYGADPNRVAIGGDSAGGYLAALVTQFVTDDPTIPDFQLQVLVYPIIQYFHTNSPAYQKYAWDFGDGGPLPRKQIATYLSYHMFGKYDGHFIDSVTADSHMPPGWSLSDEFNDRYHHSLIPTDLKHPQYYDDASVFVQGDENAWNKHKKWAIDPRSNPLNRQNFTGLAPALIITCGFDSLRDEGIFYGQALSKADVDVEWKHYEGAFHGIMYLGPTMEFKLGRQMQTDVIEFLSDRL